MRTVILSLLVLSAFTLHLNHQQSQKVQDVIIIGAGISGIAASIQLSQDKIPHLILEAKEVIGGRISATELNGQSVELGANYIHNPNRETGLYSLLQKQNMPLINQSSSQTFAVNDSLLKAPTPKIEQAQQAFQRSVKRQLKRLENDTDLQTSWDGFLKQNNGKFQVNVLAVLHQRLRAIALLSGGDLIDMSAASYYKYLDADQTVAPEGGFYAALRRLFQKYCTFATLRLRSVVSEIDYSGENVKIKTVNGDIFYAKNVISSLPLGVLKAKDVKFKPQLPESHQNAIHALGLGLVNKVILALNKPFWKEGSSWLDFIPVLGQKTNFIEATTLSKNNSIVQFYTGGKQGLQLDKSQDQLITYNLLKHIKTYVKNGVDDLAIINSTITRYENDPFVRGSYSYLAVGSTCQTKRDIGQPIQNKLFFIGQHTSPNSSLAQDAFMTGIQAASRVSDSLRSSSSSDSEDSNGNESDNSGNSYSDAPETEGSQSSNNSNEAPSSSQDSSLNSSNAQGPQRSFFRLSSQASNDN